MEYRSSLIYHLKTHQLESLPGSGKFFLPIDDLRRILTKTVVEKELERIYPGMRSRESQLYTNIICSNDGAKKLFVILLQTKEEAITGFLDESIRDQHLPLVRIYTDRSPTNSPNYRPYTLAINNHTECKLTLHNDCSIQELSTWTAYEIEDLYRNQWWVQAPVFLKSNGIPHLDLDTDAVMPYFENHEEDTNGEWKPEPGGYARVWMAIIHPAHQDIYKPGNNNKPRLAVKRLNTRNREEFEIESELLRNLMLTHHSHLVKLLATYALNNQFYFLFPYADRDLRSYWKSVGRPTWCRETFYWTLDQMAGLASGLNVIHNFRPYSLLGFDQINNELTRSSRSFRGRPLIVKEGEEMFGRHGDLKPENILYINESSDRQALGTLQITDLWLGRFYRSGSKSRVDPTMVSGSASYMPPEDTLAVDISRAYDIWSLGCIFLEFVTWLLEGFHAIETFSDSRLEKVEDGVIDDVFFTATRSKTAIIRKGVVDWVQKLRKNPHCSPMISDLLNLIMDHMLQVDPEKRYKSRMLRSSFKEIWKKAQSDKYLLGAAVIDAPVDSGYGSSMGLVNETLDDQDERMTVLSGDQSLLDFPERDDLVYFFAKGLRIGLGPLFRTTRAVLDIEEPVFNLLKDFTLRLQQDSLDPMKRNAAKFVRQNRKRIAKSLHDDLESELTILHDDQDAEPTHPMVPWEHRIDGWIPDFDPDPIPEDDMSIFEDRMAEFGEAGSSTEDLEEAIKPEFDSLHTYLKESDAYQWLITKIKALALLTREDEGALTNVRRIVGGAYDDLDQSGAPAIMQTLEFKLTVDLKAFLSWYWENSTCTDLRNALTLTGTPVDAQALTCEEYLKQTWPTYGVEILRHLEEALKMFSNSSAVHQSKLSDGTKIVYQVFGELITFAATGTRPSLVEIGEQLAWLCSALRSSKYEDSISLSTAMVECSKSTIQIYTHCEIVPKLELESSQNGCCWHHLFQNPVVVQGFPTLARRHGERGLEIPVDIMAGLGNSDYHVLYKGVPVLKSFSSMFLATQQLACSMLWHFVFDSSGHRMPYAKIWEYHRNDSVIGSFATSNVTRNFVGWTSSIRRLAGTRAADYPGITKSKLGECTAGFILEKATLSGGKFVMAGITLGPGARNRVLRFQSERSYHEAVAYATHTYVNFYDVEDRRGWLLDGARAVLHLTLAQMIHPRSHYSMGNHFDIETFKFASPDDGANSAASALNDEFNKNIVIDQDPSEVTVHKTTKNGVTTEEKEESVSKKYFFWEQVRFNLSRFEHMTDYQKEQIEVIRGTTRERLEGWEFLQLVEGEKSVKPKFAYLESSGRGWVDLLREIYAVNLLGTGFGALIQPVDGSAELCEYWKEVPKHRDYMTVDISTLQDIREKFGEMTEDPIQIAPNIYLHQGGHIFEKCNCGTGESACDRVQVVLPKLSTPKRNPESLFSRANCNGAVIFGRSERFSWSFPSIGPPRKKNAGEKSNTKIARPFKEYFKSRRTPTPDSGYGTKMSTSSPSSGFNLQANASPRSVTSTPTEEPNTRGGPSLQKIASTLRNAAIPANKMTVPRPRRMKSPPDSEIQAPDASDVSNLPYNAVLQGSSSQNDQVQGTSLPSRPMSRGSRSKRGLWPSIKQFWKKVKTRPSKG